MAANTLISPVLSGLVLLAIVVAVLRFRGWRRSPTAETGSRSPEADLSKAFRNPTTWTVGFLLLVLVAVAGSLAVVGALPIPEGYQSAVGTALLAAAALVLGGFVFAGVYTSVRNRGYGSAPAAGLGSLVVGFLALLVVVIQLLAGW